MSIAPQSQTWLDESWSRSHAAGLEQSTKPDGLRLNANDLAERHHLNQSLIEVVMQQALPLFNQLMARTQSRLILSDSDGYLLRYWGVSQYADKFANISLDVGVNWEEQHKGTNAIGTALSHQKPIVVIGEQHFIKHHRFMSCSASPIFSPSGKLLAVLDITSDQQRHSQQVLLLISNMVQRIETALLCQLPDSHYRIDFSADASLLSSGWQGIVVANEAGRLLACNPIAKQILKQAQVGDDISDYFGEQWRSTKTAQQQALYLSTQMLQLKSRPLLKSASHVQFHDPKLDQAWQHANKVIARNIPLLILGETGVGKEQFVKKLHQQSHRNNAPLVAINCAALAKELVESELFGYQGGAFTGANKQGYIGKIRQADKGFLFLDEIGEMPAAVQTRLLRVLQEREVNPVGSTQSYNVDIQVIAASHCDLQALVKQGLFREDLYYRLNGLQVELPALRQRKDMLRILEKFLRRYQLEPQTICPDLLQKICAYDWPGNLRQLDNFMHVACLMAEGEAVLAWQHLPASLQAQLSGSKTGGDHLNLASQVDHNIQETYQRCNQNISHTAQQLGISRNTLYRKLKKLGLKS